MQSKNIVAIYLMLSLSGVVSCKKLVEVSPPVTQIDASSAYSTNATAAAVLTGIYDEMSSGGGSNGMTGISLLAGLSSDELRNYSTNSPYPQFYANQLSSQSFTYFWQEFYQYIYTANSAIEGISSSQSLSANVKQQLLGEAKFMRAFCYFYLVNLFSDVPLILSTNYQENMVAARTPQAQVYQQIVTDLVDAQGLLSTNYVGSDAVTASVDRVRPTKWAATALLARVYLYTSDWPNAESQADSVLSNTTLFNLDTLNGAFLANSSEAIWQLMPVNAGYNTLDGLVFILTSGPNNYANPVALSPFLLASFEPNDNRMIDWIGIDSSTGAKYYYPYKYKVGPYNSGQPLIEYLMVLRLAEQYLIRAEARAEQGELALAASDLNVVRVRAGLDSTSAATQPELLTAIFHERQVELFTEWGHRWLDLKRAANINSIMENVNSVMGAPGNVCNAKGGTWNQDWQLYPIPLTDVKTDPNLSQNAGY